MMRPITFSGIVRIEGLGRWKEDAYSPRGYSTRTFIDAFLKLVDRSTDPLPDGMTLHLKRVRVPRDADWVSLAVEVNGLSTEPVLISPRDIQKSAQPILKSQADMNPELVVKNASYILLDILWAQFQAASKLSPIPLDMSKIQERLLPIGVNYTTGPGSRLEWNG